MVCPSEAELLAFHLGELPEPQIAIVGEHLTSCAQCAERTQRLDDSTDTVLSALRERRTIGSGPLPDPPGYEVLGLVGRGGMGLVYKARQSRLDRLVALKFLRTQGAADLSRFEAEARAVARLGHPHIVQIIEVGQWQGQLFLALEYLGGGTLADHLTGKPQDPRATATLVQTLARAVHHAHTHGIVHRDLKPANILLVSGGVVIGEWSGSKRGDEVPLTTPPLTAHHPKISDFGIAKHLQSSGQTREGDIVGTANYMSPEQAAGGGAQIGPASDIYSLGVILYEMLTGRVPLQGASDLETVLMVRSDEPVSPRRLQPKLSRDLETICLKCLHKEPGRRYASAEALADDLGRMLAGEPIAARPTPFWERGWKWARRRPAAAVLMLLAGLIVGVGLPGVTWLWMSADFALGRETAQRSKAEAAAGAEKTAKKAAELSEAEAQAVVEFLERKIMIAARAKHNGGLGEGATLREALEAALPYLEENFAGQPLVEARLRRTVGLSIDSFGDDEKAAEQFARARELYLAHRGPAHRDTILTSINLANCLVEMGRHVEAARLAEETLAIQRATPGSDDRNLFALMDILAEIHFADTGRRAEAVRLREELVALQKVRFGPDKDATLSSMDKLATCYSLLGRQADMVHLREEEFALRRAKDGLEHPSVVQAMERLQRAYGSVGRGADAIKLRQDDLAHYRDKYGPEHAKMLPSLRALAHTYSLFGKQAEARQLYEDAHQICQQQFSQSRAKDGPDHEATLASMSILADSFAALGRRDEAFQLREERLALLKAKLGPDHAETLSSMDALADQYTSVTRHSDAIKLLEDLYARRKAKSGLYSSATLLTMERLAESYFKAGRRAESLELRKEVLAFNRDKSGPEHGDTLNSMDALANCYALLRRRDESLKLYEELYVLKSAKYGPGHDTTLATANALAGQCAALGRVDEALRLREEVYKQHKARFGPDQEVTLSSMNYLASSYARFGRHDDAARLREELYALRKAKLGPDSSATLFTLRELAESYGKTGRRDEAIKLFEEALSIQKARRGPDHAETLDLMEKLADSYVIIGLRGQGLKLREEVLAIKQAKLGPDHAEALRAKRDLATNYSAAGRYADALKLHEETLAAQLKLLGPDDADTLRSMWGVAFDLVKLSRGAEAVPLIDDCVHRSAGKAVDPQMVPRVMALRREHFQKIGDAAGCRETAEIWERLNRTDASDLYVAAKMRAATAEIIGSAGQSAAADPDGTAEADRAMQWLKQAVSAGFRNSAALKSDPELKVLRDREDFQMLVAELERAQDVK